MRLPPFVALPALVRLARRDLDEDLLAVFLGLTRLRLDDERLLRAWRRRFLPVKVLLLAAEEPLVERRLLVRPLFLPPLLSEVVVDFVRRLALCLWRPWPLRDERLDLRLLLPLLAL